MNEKGHNPEPGFARIKPVAIDLARDSTVVDEAAPGKVRSRHLRVGLSLGLLLVSAALVVFLLPRWVSPPVVATDPVPNGPAESPPAAPPRPQGTASPWEKAQESKLRSETQHILEQMLDAQKLLSESGVTIWAALEYEQALQLAKSGDDRYNQRDFAGARRNYEQALAILQGLKDRVDEVFKDAMTRGDEALAAGDSEAARQAFDLALAIDPLDRAAAEGRERADKLDQVMALLKKGDRLLDDGRLEEARAAYRQARELDDQSEQAGRQIALVEQRIQERDFNAEMSAGFTALYNGQPEQAHQAFTRALRLRPSSAEAKSALGQSSQQLTARTIDSLLRQAQDLEAKERWHEAVEKYEAALELDPVVAAAQSGRERSALRAQIGDRLDQILARPERLYDADALNEAIAFHARVRELSNPGPVLSAQLDRVSNLLAKMSQPVTVQLRSDNLTRVTLYKVGELGFFTSQEVQLRPGRYVAVGIRDGYRDVRVEFTVDPDQPAPVISIQADHKIAFGSEA